MATVWIKKAKVQELSTHIRQIIDGQNIDLRDNKEGEWSALKNDIHTLASLKNERVAALKTERDTMSQTLANISHQLKTPLTAMMLMTELLENAPPERQQEFIANIKTGVLRMEWLASTLLKMAKLDAGVVDFAKAPVPAETLVAQALMHLQVLLDAKEQTVDIHCPTSIVCDRHWTIEAITNVIKNASEHSPQGGKIYVESGSNPICHWLLVRDSGQGIQRDKIPHLFKRFESSDTQQGHGIGLALSLAILRGQGGDILVDGGGSQGVGATFILKWF